MWHWLGIGVVRRMLLSAADQRGYRLLLDRNGLSRKAAIAEHLYLGVQLVLSFLLRPYHAARASAASGPCTGLLAICELLLAAANLDLELSLTLSSGSEHCSGVHSAWRRPRS